MKTSRITSHKYFTLATLFLLCFLLYGNTLHNSYAEDDPMYITGNKFILKGFSAFKDIWDKGSLYGWVKSADYIQQYRPLTMLNFMAEVSIFGLNPHLSHFFNVLFFAFTVVLLYFFLQKILNEARPDEPVGRAEHSTLHYKWAEHSTLHYKREIIIAATLLFAFHPIHTEVVANIKSRDEILCLLFGLISFYCILLNEETKWAGRFVNRPYILSLLAFFAALFCKESALTFIAIIPLLLYYFTDIKLKNIAFKTIPYFFLVGIYLFIRSRVLQSIAFTHQIPISDNALMSTNSSADRLATSFVLLGKYIYMLFIPYPLSWDYSYDQIPIVSWVNIKPILSLLVCAGLIVFALWSMKRKSIFSFLILFFFITLSLSCNVIVKIAATFGERFLYVPSLAFCIALPILTAKTLNIERIRNVRFFKFFIPIAIGIRSSFFIPIGCLLIVYTVIVIPRNAEWKNNFTLFSSGVITSPNSEKTHGCLAYIYLDTAQNSRNKATSLQYYALAAHEFKKEMELDSWAKDTDCYLCLGICYYGEGSPDSAIPAFNQVLELKPKYSFFALNYMGLIYLNKKKYDIALPYFLHEYKADSNNLPTLLNIALCYQNEGSFILALHYDSLILKKSSDYIPAILSDMYITHNNIAVQYFQNNELDNALAEFYIALSIDSNSVLAIKNIALVYEKKGNKEMAKRYAEKAMEKEQRAR